MLNQRFIYIIILAVVCFLIYANSLHNAFVLDDIPAILHNFKIQNLFSFWLDPQSFLNSLAYNIGKFDVVPYHLISIVLHFINTVLVFFFLRLFFKTIPSFLGALIFAVHPIHTEVVVWISGRPYLTLTFFTLITYLLYYRATYRQNLDRKSQTLFYVLSLLIFSYFIIKNYTFYAFFPFFIILSDVVFNRWRKNWKLWLPFFFIAILRVILAGELLGERIISTIAYLNYDAGKTEIWRNPAFPFIYSIFLHFWLLLWPARLTFYHEPIIFYPSAMGAGFIILFIFAWLLPYIFKKARVILFGIGMFVLFLFPTYSPLPVATIVAERYAYFPSVLLSILAAFSYEEYFRRIELRKRKWVTVLFIFVIIAYGARAIVRNMDWKDSSVLFKATLKLSPNSPSTHRGMGTVYFHEGNIDRAIEEFNTAIKLKSNYTEAYNDRGVAYYNRGDFNQALSDFNTAIKLKPDYALAYYNWGVAYYNRGDFNQAILQWNKAIEIDRDYAQVYNDRAIAYFFKQEYNRSWADIHKVEKLGYKVDPRFLEDLKKASAREK